MNIRCSMGTFNILPAFGIKKEERAIEKSAPESVFLTTYIDLVRDIRVKKFDSISISADILGLS